MADQLLDFDEDGKPVERRYKQLIIIAKHTGIWFFVLGAIAFFLPFVYEYDDFLFVWLCVGLIGYVICPIAMIFTAVYLAVNFRIFKRIMKEVFISAVFNLVNITACTILFALAWVVTS